MAGVYGRKTIRKRKEGLRKLLRNTRFREQAKSREISDEKSEIFCVGLSLSTA